MRSMTISPQMQQILAVGVPIAAMVISVAVVYPAWGRYGQATAQVTKLQQELKELQDTPLPERDPVMPAVDDGPRESAQFLGQIVALSLAPRCRFTGMETKPNSSVTSDGTLRSVRSKVEVEGVYPQVRQFLAEIKNSPRLFVVTGMDVSAQVTSNQPGVAPGTLLPGVRAAIDIERYVIPPNAPGMYGQPGSPGTPAPAAGATGTAATGEAPQTTSIQTVIPPSNVKSTLPGAIAGPAAPATGKQ